MELPLIGFIFSIPSFYPIQSFTAIHNVDGDFNIVSNLVRLMDIFTFQFLFSSMKKE